MAELDKVFEAESAAAAPKRTNDTDIQGLDEVISISEDCINAVLAARFHYNAKRKKDRRLREFRHAISDYGDISATLGAPRIQMIVPEDPESVYFFLNFETGSFQYWVGFGPKARPKTQEVKGWSVAFKTSFGLKKLASIPKTIADQITLLKPGSYSASQLILSLSAAVAAEIDWTASSCPGLDENPDLKFAGQNMFKSYMAVYWQWLATGPYSVLGYAIKVEDKSANASLSAPSFPPTAVKCRTQAYIPQTSDFATKLPGSRGLDCLIFEEMTENRRFPDVPYDPAKAGNWVVGGIAANLVLSKRVFFESFLCSKFALLNMQALALANDAYWWVHKDARKGYKPNDWILDGDQKPSSAPWSVTATGAEYAAKFENLKGNSSFWGGQWHDNLTTHVKNELKVMTDSDALDFSVDIKIHRDEWNGGTGESTDNLTAGTTKISWSGTITLGAIKDGVLNVEVKYSAPKLEHQYSSSLSFWDWGGQEKATYVARAIAAMEQGVKGLSKLQEDMSDALNVQSKFIFPGGGDFYMKNARFNGQADLLIELSFTQKAIVIDDDFHLQAAAPNDPGVHGKWLKVDNSSDDSSVVLVDEQEDATLFQIDDGNFVVDQTGLPTGSHAVTQLIPGNDCVQQLRFVTKETFDKRKGSKDIDFSTTGSSFDFFLAAEKERGWFATFTLDPETNRNVSLFKGDADHAAPYRPFRALAIY